MDLLRLTKLGFDNLENEISRAVVAVDLGLFVDDVKGTAYHKISKLLETKTITPYLGHDYKVYPQYVVTKEYVR